MLLPIDLPPGVLANGTEYEAKGRWRSANLIRWYNGHMRPIGGWQRFTTEPLSGPVRTLLTWRDNTAAPRLAAGTFDHLYLHDGSLAYDISPTDLVPGRDSGNLGLGYGANNYGASTYGTPRTSSGLVLDATVWDLDNYGANLIALSPADGRIFMWTPPNTGAPATEIGNLGPTTLNAPVGSTTGGALPAGTYFYKVTALGLHGETIGSNEVSVTTTGGTSSVALSWTAITGAASYRVYRGTAAGAESIYFAATGATFTDVNGASTAGTVPTTDTSSNAPRKNRGVVVTDERFIVALGADGDPRAITWCSQEDYTQWVATATNTAGSLQLNTNGLVLNARRMPGELIIFTDVDVHSMRFIGAPFVYGMQRIGTNCGMLGRKAHAATQNFCVWMGQRSFYIYDGVVRPLPCEVQEYVFDNLNTLQASKVVAGVNSQFGEIWWLYPSANANENDSYVIWNYKENWWSVGQLARTAWTDREVWPYPIAAGADGSLFQQEQGWTDSGMTRVGTVYAESGPFDLGNGDRLLVAKQMIPDTNVGGDGSLTYTFKLRNTPTGPQTVAGPYSFTREDGYMDVRFTGRQANLRVDLSADVLFQLGTLRIEGDQGSAR